MNAPAFIATPTSGSWRGRVHVFPVRVYYEDTDAAGIVYHANYLRYAERARTEMLRALGVELSRAREEHGFVFVLREATMKYRKPARLDDTLTVESKLLKLGGASLQAHQSIRRGAEELVGFDAELACMNDAGKPVRMPAPLRAKLESYVAS